MLKSWWWLFFNFLSFTLNPNGWNAQEKNSLNQHTFPKCTISILWKTLHFFTWIFFKNCPKPFALAQTHLQMKDNQPAQLWFDVKERLLQWGDQIKPLLDYFNKIYGWDMEHGNEICNMEHWNDRGRNYILQISTSTIAFVAMDQCMKCILGLLG